VAGLQGQPAEAHVAREELALVADGRAGVVEAGDRCEQRDVDARGAAALLGAAAVGGGGRPRALAEADLGAVAGALHAAAQHDEAAAVREDELGGRAGGRQLPGLDRAQRHERGLAAAHLADRAVDGRVADGEADDLICNETLHGSLRCVVVAARAV
jgi:hypothetical protein